MNRNYIKYISALLLFGSNGIVASYIFLNSYEIVFLRTLIGSLFLISVFVISKSKFWGLQNKKHLAYLTISGAAMGASWMFLYEAYRQIGVSLATLAYYCGPVIVMALAPLVFKEKTAPVKMVRFLAVLIGMFLVNRHILMKNGFSWGLLYGVMAAVMYAFMVIFNKKAVRIKGL
jgi:drug/metabolite transporter (DMT)-like permease